jgi:hypothetical protein
MVRTPDLWLEIYEDNVLFVYADGGALGDDGHPHGECAVRLP